MKSRKSPAKPASTTPLSTANQQPQEVVKDSQNQKNAAPPTKKNHGRQAKHEEIKIKHHTNITQKQTTETGVNELREYAFKDEPCEIGIDEAGRGPVLGPMVYGLNTLHNNLLMFYKFTDSKQLNEQQREEMFEQIKSCEFSRLGYFTAVLHADYLSNLMLAEMKSGGKNLNTISHDTAIDLIKKVKALGVNVKRVVLDTQKCKIIRPHSYKQLLHNRLKDDELEIIVESKADLNHPVVSAASICAKVTRDQVLADWQFPEDKKIDTDYGCGYPGDPKAKEWLKRNLDPVFGFPTLVRFSWKTCSTILEDNQVNINWRDDIDEKDKKYCAIILSNFLYLFNQMQQTSRISQINFHQQQKLNYGAKKEDVVGLPKYKTKTQKERYNNKALRQTGVRREFEL